MDVIPIWISLFFFFIALFYSMVGFGGGSSYLAVLVLAGLPYQQIPPLALVCNLIVTTGGFWNFYRAGHFRLGKALPFVALSIPMAYWGGTFLIGKRLFSLLLGISLMAVAARMIITGKEFQSTKEISPKQTWIFGLPVGAGLGFLSGLIGIGGGIFLSPLLLLMRWVNAKESAAAASFFIVVNSFAGLMGHWQKGVFQLEGLLPLGVAVFLGGQIGSRLGAYRLPQVSFQRFLAGLIFYVSARLIWGGIMVSF